MPVLVQRSDQIGPNPSLVSKGTHDKPVAFAHVIAVCEYYALIKRTVLMASLVSFCGAFSRSPLPPDIASSAPEFSLHPLQNRSILQRYLAPSAFKYAPIRQKLH